MKNPLSLRLAFENRKNNSLIIEGFLNTILASDIVPSKEKRKVNNLKLGNLQDLAKEKLNSHQEESPIIQQRQNPYEGCPFCPYEKWPNSLEPNWIIPSPSTLNRIISQTPSEEINTQEEVENLEKPKILIK